LAAADDAIELSDDFIRAGDELTPPWSVAPDPPPPATVESGTVAPTVSRSPSSVQAQLDALREDDLIELVQTGACALLKYVLEYAEIPDAASIEEYLRDESERRTLIWLEPEDEAILASELEALGFEIADAGLPGDSLAQLALDVCEALP
jgi:hypothetical protein